MFAIGPQKVGTDNPHFAQKVNNNRWFKNYSAAQNNRCNGTDVRIEVDFVGNLFTDLVAAKEVCGKRDNQEVTKPDAKKKK